jgi:hypothetical protein
MPEGDLSPVPKQPGPSSGGHYRDDDDIELPPMPGESAGESSSWDGGTPTKGAQGTDRKPAGLTSWLASAAIAGAILVGGWMYVRGGPAETEHPNWQHVSAAEEASADGVNYVTHTDGGGAAQVVQTVEVSSRDRNRAATQQIRKAVLDGDLAAATAALQAAQTIPDTDPNVQLPDLLTNPALASLLKDRSNELYEIVLSDCCAEDGDIVEVLVNDVSFATVPIMHQGTTVTIPLGRGNNTVTIRGVKDGGGGVTLSFRTSRGDFFCRSMAVGEEYRMGVVVK